ncbi:fringe glycosyltransferase-like isoform X2 [Photinus pyralis]|nr:fringe glycosyltransferase-like isoform X2 [Photinus pyralis]
MAVIHQTWFQLAKKQTWFFTDVEDEKLQNLTDGHMINTKCGESHSRRDLCCKMGVEISTFMTASESKWFCHFDDDNYINIPKLVDVLNGYDPDADWYLGKLSLDHPAIVTHNETKKTTRFWFGTGGAGVCISRPLVTKMKPFTIGDQFMRTCDLVAIGDDATMGYILHAQNISLTVIDRFHSHYEQFKCIPRETIEKEIVLSYKGENILEIEGFDLETDPTRFMSLHCVLFPNADLCTTMKRTYTIPTKNTQHSCIIHKFLSIISVSFWCRYI